MIDNEQRLSDAYSDLKEKYSIQLRMNKALREENTQLRDKVLFYSDPEHNRPTALIVKYEIMLRNAGLLTIDQLEFKDRFVNMKKYERVKLERDKLFEKIVGLNREIDTWKNRLIKTPLFKDEE